MFLQKMKFHCLLSVWILFTHATGIWGDAAISKEYIYQNSNLGGLRATKVDSFQTDFVRFLEKPRNLENDEDEINNQHFLTSRTFIFVEAPYWLPIETKEHQEKLRIALFMFLSHGLEKEIPDFVEILSIEYVSYITLKSKKSEASDEEYEYFLVSFIVRGLVDTTEVSDDFNFGFTVNQIMDSRYYEFLDGYFKDAGLYNNTVNMIPASLRGVDLTQISSVADISKSILPTLLCAALLVIVIQIFAVGWYTKSREKKPLKVTVIKKTTHNNSFVNQNDDYKFERDDKSVGMPELSELHKNSDSSSQASNNCRKESPDVSGNSSPCFPYSRSLSTEDQMKQTGNDITKIFLDNGYQQPDESKLTDKLVLFENQQLKNDIYNEELCNKIGSQEIAQSLGKECTIMATLAEEEFIPSVGRSVEAIRNEVDRQLSGAYKFQESLPQLEIENEKYEQIKNGDCIHMSNVERAMRSFRDEIEQASSKSPFRGMLTKFTLEKEQNSGIEKLKKPTVPKIRKIGSLLDPRTKNTNPIVDDALSESDIKNGAFAESKSIIAVSEEQSGRIESMNKYQESSDSNSLMKFVFQDNKSVSGVPAE